MSKNKSNEIPIVTCPYCAQQAQLVDSKTIYPHSDRDYGKFWHCPTDQAWVGVHKNSPRFAPLGRLANAELRDWKMKAHAVFDPFWKGGLMNRRKAYKMMQQILGVSKAEAHIGMLNVEQCQALIQELTTNKHFYIDQAMQANGATA